MRGLFGEAVPEVTAVRAVGFALVAVERAVDRFPEGLLYAVPEPLASAAEGDRVVVPLGTGNTPTAGYIVRRVASDSNDLSSLAGGAAEGAPERRGKKVDPRKVKSILEVDPAHARLPGELLQLTKWVSGYYCCPIGMTLAGILPAAVRHGIGATKRTLIHLVAPANGSTSEPDGVGDGAGQARSRSPSSIGSSGDRAVPDRDAGRLTAKQQAILEVLAAAPLEERPLEQREVLTRAGVATPQPLRALAERGLITIERRTEVEARFLRGDLEAGRIPTPTSTQHAVIDSISARLNGGFSQHLLFGVTGSGKTEVYIRLIERTLALGKRALVLVPEIGLTPQTAGRLVGRFPGRRVAILHSGLTASQRHQMWTTVVRGEADIVIGARSAVFAPWPDRTLGIIVVDEEHDASYKSDLAPRYHGRDVAIRRAQLAGCPVILGSATPSLESWANATRRGLSTLHRLPERAPGLTTPKVVIVDFAEERRRFRDRRVHLVGPTLRQALGETLGVGGQAVILLNRRGYANYVACTDPRCDWVFRCDQCDAGMVCHRLRFESRDGAVGRREFTRCHHCESELRLPPACPQCGKKVTVFGLGTQRVEEELARDFPQLVEGRTMLRVDADAMQGEGDFREALERFASGEVQVLLGTQMIAKGLDFPNVRLVGVISADTALHLPDFRSAERTFQLVSQVAGRCGRGDHAGRAIVQTLQPHAKPILLAAHHEFERFAELELTSREEFGLPPARRMARLVVRDAGETACAELAARLAKELHALAPNTGDAGDGQRGSDEPNETHPERSLAPVEVRGPSPCPIARIAGRYRFQIELFAATASELARFLTRARNASLLALGEQLAVDVDPVFLM